MNETNSQSTQTNQSTPSSSSPRVRNKDNFFYYDFLTEEEKDIYDRGGIETDNLDAEIKLLKLWIGAMIRRQPPDPTMVVRMIQCAINAIKLNVKDLHRLKPDLMKYRRTLQVMFRDAPASLIQTMSEAMEKQTPLPEGYTET